MVEIHAQINADGSQKSVNDWHPVGVTIHNGASIGAGAVCIAPITIGRWAMVAAGSVVTTDVADYSLVSGNLARHIGGVAKLCYLLGHDESSNHFACPVTGEKYSLINETMVPA
jgi:UDP-2-acetamido-3-amino-2,3-dideoxy-glucuronate N-acetyltransferase